MEIDLALNNEVEDFKEDYESIYLEIIKEACKQLDIHDDLELSVIFVDIKSDENYTKLEDMSEFYKDAVIAVEDRRFYEHGAIDPIALARAIYSNIKAKELREGGSTITQQLAKNIYFTQEKSALRKIAEIFMAYDLEKNLNKETDYKVNEYGELESKGDNTTRK